MVSFFLPQCTEMIGSLDLTSNCTFDVKTVVVRPNVDEG